MKSAPIRENLWPIAVMPGFHQLQQHAARTRRMHEHIAMSAGADFDFVRDQPHTVFLQTFDRRRQGPAPDADVVQSFAVAWR